MLKAKLGASRMWKQTNFQSEIWIKFDAVIDMSIFITMEALVKEVEGACEKKHGDVPNAYVKEKEKEDIYTYIQIPQVMQVRKDMETK